MCDGVYVWWCECVMVCMCDGVHVWWCGCDGVQVWWCASVMVCMRKKFKCNSTHVWWCMCDGVYVWWCACVMVCMRKMLSVSLHVMVWMCDGVYVWWCGWGRSLSGIVCMCDGVCVMVWMCDGVDDREMNNYMEAPAGGGATDRSNLPQWSFPACCWGRCTFCFSPLARVQLLASSLSLSPQ